MTEIPEHLRKRAEEARAKAAAAKAEPAGDAPAAAPTEAESKISSHLLERAKAVAARVDVVVENFRPGVAARLGLGAEALRAENPRLVYCSISGFGQQGPFRDLPAYDLVNGVRDRDFGPLAGLRLLAKRLLTRLAAWISGKRVLDLNTGMKVFKRDLALSYLWALPDGFSCVSSLSILLEPAIRFHRIPLRCRSSS